MSRGIWLFILYLAGTSGQSMFSSKNDYKDMTDFFEPRHRGGFNLPPCIKDLMNCWEVMNPDVVCKNDNNTVIRFDTVCMDMRFQCRETVGYKPFPKDRYIPDIFDYCTRTKQLALGPYDLWMKKPY